MGIYISFVKTVGRRKKATANLKLYPGSGQIQINNQLIEEFFVGSPLRILITQRPFRIIVYPIFDANIKVMGGGLQSQAKASQLALARALVLNDPLHHKAFRAKSFLTCDSRNKERRKYGCKKARKAPQFSKR
jgi:small subunit ribosomal protein S9